MAHATLRKTSRHYVKMASVSGPRPETVRAILNFSKALKIVEVPPIGKVDIVLN